MVAAGGQLTVRALPGGRSESVVEVVPGRRLFVEANRDLDTSLTPWVPLLTPIAMRRAAALRFEGPVARAAGPASRAAQAVLSGWYPELVRVDVEADWTDPPPPAEGVGLFFSGGVDSFYSALLHTDEVTHLIFVTGFDIGLKKTWLVERALDEIGAIAAELGKELLTARTNIRSLSNRYCSWGRQYHGAALAGIAHFFAPVIGTAIIPSSLSHPWGSDPELDPLWSSTVRIVHDSPAGRMQKVARIAGSDLALRHLRVCYCTHEGEYNCGHCEKCQRTMISLHAVGALERAHTLPRALDPRAIGRLELKGSAVTFARENLAALRQRPVRDRPVERALDRAIRLAPVHAAVRRGRRTAGERAARVRALLRRARRGAARRLRGLRRS